MLENAITIPVFIIVLISIFDLARIAYTALGMQFTLNRAARTSIVDTTNANNKAQAVRNIITNTARSYGVIINGNSDVTFCAADQPQCCVSGTPPAGCDAERSTVGGRNQLFRIALKKSVPTFIPGFSFNLQRMVLAKNEPY